MKRFLACSSRQYVNMFQLKNNVLSFLSFGGLYKRGSITYNKDYKYVKEMLSWIILNTLWHKRVQRNTSNFVVKMYGSDNKFNEKVSPLFHCCINLATLEVKNTLKVKCFYDNSMQKHTFYSFTSHGFMGPLNYFNSN